MGKLDDKIALVTGASRGIGKAIREAFANEGANVISASRADGCDVSREEDVERLFAGIKRLDILVNNAGILTPRKPMVEVTAREWDESLAVNLRGVFLCTRAALRLMIPQRSGLIINVSSGAGKRAAPHWGPYAVAKWGVEGFTKTVAEEVKPHGIKIVAVNPGGTRTQMRAAAYPDEDPMTLKTPEELAKFFVALASGAIKFQSGDSLDYERTHG
jgi:NAD(P)-dependent dehydrogenase (short-subunit alcohol dehydrogenase family)